MIECIVALATATMFAGCDEKPPPQKYTLLEVINLKGTCKEDHANKAGEYVGSVVRYRADKTGKMLTYGSVMAPDIAKHLMDDVEHPTVYEPPFMISFDNVHLDTTQNHWTLHGVSDSRSNGEDETDSGYASTCELEVVGRGTKLPPLPNQDNH